MKGLDPPATESVEADEIHAAKLLSALGLTWDALKGKRILDIGAGRGQLARAAKRRGIEVVPVALAQSKHATVPSLVVADASNLPFSDNSFDMAVCAYGPLTFPDGEDVLVQRYREAVRVVRGGGDVRVAGPLKIFTDGTTGGTEKLLAMLTKHFPSIESRQSNDAPSDSRFARVYFQIVK
jgi:ubiquinone/menaquinone biosynthesis C-methylase UbiE